MDVDYLGNIVCLANRYKPFGRISMKMLNAYNIHSTIIINQKKSYKIYISNNKLYFKTILV